MNERERAYIEQALAVFRRRVKGSVIDGSALLEDFLVMLQQGGLEIRVAEQKRKEMKLDGES